MSCRALRTMQCDSNQSRHLRDGTTPGAQSFARRGGSPVRAPQSTRTTAREPSNRSPGYGRAFSPSSVTTEAVGKRGKVSPADSPLPCRR